MDLQGTLMKEHIGEMEYLASLGMPLQAMLEIIWRWRETHCSNCGEVLAGQEIGGYVGTLYDRWFCCDGCRVIWLLENGLSPSVKLQVLNGDTVVYESE